MAAVVKIPLDVISPDFGKKILLQMRVEQRAKMKWLVTPRILISDALHWLADKIA